ncbi:MAG: sugar ABC transporter substrate-binding protein [Opitutus sp.]|nr:sugar ABC transporter substrate-binding protein [Opitutus sp.]
MKRPSLILLTLLCFAATARAAEKPLTIGVIPKGTTNEFWKAVNAGAFKARDELRAQGIAIDVLWNGPLKEDDRERQIQVVENFIARRVSGIVVAPLDSRALVQPVVAAVQAGIPVVVMDSGLNTDRQVSFVATDNHQGGVMAGERLAQLLGGKGNVILLRYQVGSASTEEREAGFLEAIKRNPGIKLISSEQHAGPTRETAYQASQNLLNRFGREVNGVFCPCELPSGAMALALRDVGLGGGRVKMVGFDAGSQSIEDLKRGDIQGLVVQDPLNIGYTSVLTMVKHLRGEKVERRIGTTVALVTRENMEQPEIRDLLNPPLGKYLKP